MTPPMTILTPLDLAMVLLPQKRQAQNKVA